MASRSIQHGVLATLPPHACLAAQQPLERMMCQPQTLSDGCSEASDDTAHAVSCLYACSGGLKVRNHACSHCVST
jgi:hypothetical protein